MVIHQISQLVSLPSRAYSIDLLCENISEGTKLFRIKLLRSLTDCILNLTALFSQFYFFPLYQLQIYYLYSCFELNIKICIIRILIDNFTFVNNCLS